MKKLSEFVDGKCRPCLEKNLDIEIPDDWTVSLDCIDGNCYILEITEINVHFEREVKI